EAGTLPGHGVLVAAGHVEDPVFDGGEAGRHRHEAVVAVHDDERLGRRYGADEGGEVGNDVTGVEEHVRQVDEVVAPPGGGIGEALRKGGEGLGGDPLHDRPAVLLQPGGLAG